MMSSQELLSEQSCPPSVAAYNIHYLSLSESEIQRRQWNKKLANVQHLVKTHEVVALIETHADAITAETFFGSSIEGTHRFYDEDIAVFVRDEWYRKHRPEFGVVIPKVMVTLSWFYSGVRHWAFFFSS